jgi:hypothetical protein
MESKLHQHETPHGRRSGPLGTAASSPLQHVVAVIENMKFQLFALDLQHQLQLALLPIGLSLQ